VAALTREQLAELVPCGVEDVARLEQLGLLSPGDDERFPSSDVHVVRLMASFDECGVLLEDVARGVAAGELSFPMGLFLPEPAALSETYEELADRLGRSAELLRRLSRELGFPARADGRLRAEDAEILELLVTTLDLADEEELSRFARLYGGSVQRLVAAGLQFFDAAVRQRVAAFDTTQEEKNALTYERAARYTELVGSIVPWLQRRHRERGVVEYLVGVTEGYMEEHGLRPPRSKQPPAIAFLDLTGYTALAEERGDVAAAEVATDLASVVRETALAHEGQTVKWLGDGVMFHFPDPGNAVRSALDLVDRTEREISIPARVGVNAGTVIAQEGDYFGTTVNVASRITDYAQPHEVLVSEEVLQSAAVSDVRFELVGDVQLRGLSRPVRLHRAVRAAG
jgi:adenylate cyclase